jgi:hypothetical protein
VGHLAAHAAGEDGVGQGSSKENRDEPEEQGLDAWSCAQYVRAQEVPVVYRQPSESRSTSLAGRARLEPSTPEDIEPHSFEIGSDRYVILSFPVGAEGPPHDAIYAKVGVRSRRELGVERERAGGTT